ncbi:hypothetical protein Ahy_B03g066663 isoform B [Arachis hypogaea]|uniref:Uncharacterized protein n=1 Tax=Arachis hypogaea TaxID=3818 RepID=A0A445A4V4_ARAHY|nr:hypothetical protein Ahy_B03g066663 isoform B [Arachis hypogaea]
MAIGDTHLPPPLGRVYDNPGGCSNAVRVTC